MTDNQNNTLNMANTATAYMDKNVAIFTANTKVTTLLSAIKGTVTAINQTATTQGLDTTGATTNKKNLHQIANDKAEHVCFGLRAYADDINDPILASAIHFTHSDFILGTTAEIVNRMQLVHDKAAAITIATLLPFNIVATDISDLQTAITNYSGAAPTKKVMQAASTAATAQLNSQFTTLRTQWGKMDNLVKTYKTAQPIFVAGYTNARKIVDLGKTMKAEELHLMPHHFEAIFGMKFQEGDTFTIRNHSTVAVRGFITDTPTVLPTTGNQVSVEPNSEVQAKISADFGGVFGHWLIIHNPADLDDAHVTVILAHGKSNSQAAPIGQQSA
jgi:hypothetical protein